MSFTRALRTGADNRKASSAGTLPTPSLHAKEKTMQNPTGSTPDLNATVDAINAALISSAWASYNATLYACIASDKGIPQKEICLHLAKRAFDLAIKLIPEGNWYRDRLVSYAEKEVPRQAVELAEAMAKAIVKI